MKRPGSSSESIPFIMGRDSRYSLPSMSPKQVTSSGRKFIFQQIDLQGQTVSFHSCKLIKQNNWHIVSIVENQVLKTSGKWIYHYTASVVCLIGMISAIQQGRTMLYLILNISARYPARTPGKHPGTWAIRHPSGTIFGWVIIQNNNKATLPETNSFPLNRGRLPKGNEKVFQPSIFRCFCC